MSCCSGSKFCKFNFPEGAPIVDNSVDSLQAKYLFLPYGTLLEAGELVRIWTENGNTKSVLLEKKIAVQVTPTGLKIDAEEFVPWQLVAFDSAMELEDIENWYFHPLYNPEEPSVVLKFKHPYQERRSLKEVLLSWLYKLRNL